MVICVNLKKCVVFFKSTPRNGRGFYEQMGDKWCGCGCCADVVVNLYVCFIGWGSGLELNFFFELGEKVGI